VILHLLAAILLTATIGFARPNLVVVLIDDMGWKDTGFAGSNLFKTPYLDGMAKNGIIFTQAYAAAPNCAPTRACLMTGQYTPRHGVYTVVDERHAPGQTHHKIIAAHSAAELKTEAFTIAEALKEAGFATGMVGMWNLGRGRNGPCTPTGQGFDSFVQPKDLGFKRDEYFNSNGEYLTDRMTDAAIEFITDARQPFFLYLAYHAIHPPFAPKPDLLKKCNGDKYAATIAALDENMGRLAKALPEDTILFFTSDNGGTRRYVEPLRGGKGTLYEGGLRVPAFASGMGIAPNQETDTLISTIDLFPTLLELAGVSQSVSHPIDGKSLVPLWRGGTLKHDALYWHFPCYVGRGTPSSAIRQGRYKLIEFFETGKVELYDLEKDPGEKNDLAESKGELARELHQKLKLWQAELAAACPTNPNPDYDSSATPKRGRGQRSKERNNQ
jgi:arylsulfatase A-like enzyme